MIIDCHFHLDEQILKTEKLIDMMDKNNIDRIALMSPVNDPAPPIPQIMTVIFQKLLTSNYLIKRIIENLFQDEKTRKLLMGDNFAQIIGYNGS